MRQSCTEAQVSYNVLVLVVCKNLLKLSTYLNTCLIFNVPYLSPGLWTFLCVWMLINIHVYNYKCSDLALSVNLPVLRPFLPHFLPHALGTKNPTSTTLNQTLQSSTFREKWQLEQSSNVFILLHWLQRAASWLSASVRSFPRGYRSAIKSSTPAIWTW